MLGSRKLHVCPKLTKMGSIIGHGIDYNGLGALRAQRLNGCKKSRKHFLVLHVIHSCSPRIFFGCDSLKHFLVL